MDSKLNLQVEEIARELSCCNIDDNEKIIIETELKFLDIHVNWNLHQAKPERPDMILYDLQRKIKEMLNIEEFSFKTFCCQMTLAQELIKYDAASSLEKILECEAWVKSLSSENCQESELLPIADALQYVALGNKAFALFKCGSIAKAKEVLHQIPDIKKMDEKQKSGIYAVKACAFIEYGISKFFKALEYISMARSMYPTMAEWHFLTGKIMSRIRHVKFPFMSVSDDEENFFRTAYKLNEKSAPYALYMAQITREKANGLFHECRYDEGNEDSLKRVDEMNAEASTLYTKLILSNQNNSNLLGRSAFGLAKLPKPHRRLDLAVDAIEQALQVCPDNPLVNHYAGLIYYRYVHDYEKGLKYLEIASKLRNYPALLDLLRLKYILNPDNYNPMPELKEALEFEYYASTTLTEMASWYFFKKHDVIKAWEYLSKATDEHFARTHKSVYVRMNVSCDLYQVMFDEVNFKIARHEYQSGEKETLLSVRTKLQKFCPESHPTDFRNLKDAILKESDRLMRRERARFGSRGIGRGRGRYGGRGRGGSGGEDGRGRGRYGGRGRGGSGGEDGRGKGRGRGDGRGRGWGRGGEDGDGERGHSSGASANIVGSSKNYVEKSTNIGFNFDNPMDSRISSSRAGMQMNASNCHSTSGSSRNIKHSQRFGNNFNNLLETSHLSPNFESGSKSSSYEECNLNSAGDGLVSRSQLSDYYESVLTSSSSSQGLIGSDCPAANITCKNLSSRDQSLERMNLLVSNIPKDSNHGSTDSGCSRRRHESAGRRKKSNNDPSAKPCNKPDVEGSSDISFYGKCDNFGNIITKKYQNNDNNDNCSDPSSNKPDVEGSSDISFHGKCDNFGNIITKKYQNNDNNDNCSDPTSSNISTRDRNSEKSSATQHSGQNRRERSIPKFASKAQNFLNKF